MAGIAALWSYALTSAGQAELRCRAWLGRLASGLAILLITGCATAEHARHSRAPSVCSPYETPPACTITEPRQQRMDQRAPRRAPDRSLDNAPFLPWPPPAPTRMGDISDALAIKGTLGAIDLQLKMRLLRHGYDRLRYFAVPGGFGITTDVERLAPSGLPAANRWLVGKEGGWTSLFSYLTSLIRGEDSQFRVFAILVTDEDLRPANFVATETDLSRWKLSGLPYLSATRSKLPVAAGTRVWLLVYEFQPSRSKGSQIVADRDGRFSLTLHARSLGLR